jgi:hypothetical protein
VDAVGVIPKDVLRDVRCRNSTYFNNRVPTGDLVRGYNGIGNYKYGELETDAEDAVIWSL